MQDIGNIAAGIKGKVSALEAGQKFGLSPNAQGFCRCPFHEEKTASMRLYEGDRGWYCFGCGQGGDVIDLVRRLYQINTRQAIVRLDMDFGLGLDLEDRPADPRVLRLAREKAAAEALERRKKEDARKAALEAYWDASDKVQALRRQIADNAPAGPYSGWNEAFCEGLREITEAEREADWWAVQAIGVDDR